MITINQLVRRVPRIENTFKKERMRSLSFPIYFSLYATSRETGEDIACESAARANARAWVLARVPTRRGDLMDFRWNHVRVPTWAACRASRLASGGSSRRRKFITARGRQNGVRTQNHSMAASIKLRRTLCTRYASNEFRKNLPPLFRLPSSGTLDPAKITPPSVRHCLDRQMIRRLLFDDDFFSDFCLKRYYSTDFFESTHYMD